MAFNMYVGNKKRWDHQGTVTPNLEYCESHRPHGEFKPAAWLPVVRFDKHFEEWFVISTGKVVAFDREGRVVPAGLKKVFNVATGGTVLTYAQDDVDEGVTDLTTGAAVTAATSYTVDQVTDALRARGLIAAGEYAKDFISDPVGVAPYNMWKWAGGDGHNPRELIKHGVQLQHQVAVLCDWVIEVPLVPVQQATETMSGAMHDTAITFGTRNWKSATALNATTRYASLVAVGDNVVGFPLDHYPVAKNTVITPITDSVSGLVTEVNSIAEVTSAGKWYLDYEVGVLFLYESGGNAIPSPFTTGSTITYYHYESAPATVSTYTSAVGDLKPGDFVTYDTNSNFTKATFDIGTASNSGALGPYVADPDYGSASDASISLQLEDAIKGFHNGIVGQVLEVQNFPKSLMENVRTLDASLGVVDRMPGTATQGMTDKITLAGASSKTVTINLLNR